MQSNWLPKLRIPAVFKSRNYALTAISPFKNISYRTVGPRGFAIETIGDVSRTFHLFSRLFERTAANHVPEERKILRNVRLHIYCSRALMDITLYDSWR